MSDRKGRFLKPLDLSQHTKKFCYYEKVQPCSICQWIIDKTIRLLNMIYFNRWGNAHDFVFPKKAIAVLDFPVLNANIFAGGKLSHDYFHFL